MIKKILFLSFILLAFACCKENKQPKTADTDSSVPEKTDETKEININKGEQEKSEVYVVNVLELVPENFTVFEKLHGDLNKDGVNDCVLIIKDTDKENIINDEYRGELDRNRRGIIIALKEGDSYKQVVRNVSCFSSENEDGGVYFAPELLVEITEKGILQFHYAHGRYGYWQYLFRYQNDTFELIGFASHSHHGPTPVSIESINFSTKKKLVSVNLNAYEDENEVKGEKWEDKWEDIQIDKLIDLNEISDIDSLEF